MQGVTDGVTGITIVVAGAVDDSHAIAAQRHVAAGRDFRCQVVIAEGVAGAGTKCADVFRINPLVGAQATAGEVWDTCVWANVNLRRLVVVANGIQAEVGFASAKAQLHAALAGVFCLHVLFTEKGQWFTARNHRVGPANQALGTIADSARYREVAARGWQTCSVPAPLIEGSDGYIRR